MLYCIFVNRKKYDFDSNFNPLTSRGTLWALQEVTIEGTKYNSRQSNSHHAPEYHQQVKQNNILAIQSEFKTPIISNTVTLALLSGLII
jgi:hypothetical protein